jgi:hypothetical protein
VPTSGILTTSESDRGLTRSQAAGWLIILVYTEMSESFLHHEFYDATVELRMKFKEIVYLRTSISVVYRDRDGRLGYYDILSSLAKSISPYY